MLFLKVKVNFTLRDVFTKKSLHILPTRRIKQLRISSINHFLQPNLNFFVTGPLSLNQNLTFLTLRLLSILKWPIRVCDFSNSQRANKKISYQQQLKLI